MKRNKDIRCSIIHPQSAGNGCMKRTEIEYSRTPTAIRRLHAAIIRKVLAFSDFQLRPDVNLAQVKRTCNRKMAMQPQNSFSDLEKPHLNTTTGWE